MGLGIRPCVRTSMGLVDLDLHGSMLCKDLADVLGNMLVGRSPTGCRTLSMIANLPGSREPFSAHTDGIGFRSMISDQPGSLNQMGRGVDLVSMSEKCDDQVRHSHGERGS